jgi:uncharacterized protein (TIGR00645 family)
MSNTSNSSRKGAEMSRENIPDHGWVEEAFETALFSCRFLVLVPVLGILAASVVMFFKGCVEVVQGMRAFQTALSFQPSQLDDKNVILSFIPAVDNYLFATILLIISMGLYELFISEIDPKSRKEKSRPNWLCVRDLDDLTSRIGEVVIMILIVNFFKLSFSVNIEHPIDLLALGGGVLLISGSLVVAHHVSGKRRKTTGKTADQDLEHPSGRRASEEFHQPATGG